jgi:3-deoxy-D-arabino-heptulosonate 7-phosphate (DAHP) synthase class II
VYESEYSYKGNQGLINWLREIAKPIGLKVGGKTARELMDEIQQRLERNANNKN